MLTTEEYLKLNRKSPFYSEPYNGIEEDKQLIREYNKALCKKYPWLVPSNRWSGKRITDCGPDGEDGYFPGSPTERVEYDYEYTELDEMPDGWRLAFGDAMCEELEAELEKFDYQNKYFITQIKEKWGYLHWYDAGIPVGKLSENFELLKTDNWNKLIQSSNHDEDHYVYEGVDDEDNLTVYKHYKILDKCKVWDIIHKYERLSAITCIDCGKQAHWTTTGWISPYCEECKEALESNKDFYDSFELIEEEENNG